VTAPISASSTAPPQVPSTLSSTDDALGDLYTLISQVRENDVASSDGQVAANDAEKKQEEAAETQAIQEQAANAASAGRGFFSSVGHIIGDFVSDLAHGDVADAFEDAGNDIEEAWNSPAFWSDLETGLKDIALVAGAVGATVATAGIGGAAVGGILIATSAVGATAGAGAALAGIRVGDFAADAEDASGDATAATDRFQELGELTDDLIADLKDSDEAHGQSLQTLTQAIETNDDAGLVPASMTVRG
jgi:hypothetical protein